LSSLLSIVRKLTVVFSLSIIAAGCQPDQDEGYSPRFADTPPNGAETLVFGVHPLHNPHRLFQVYQPLVDHINRGLKGPRLRLEASRSYGEFEKKLAARTFAFALPNPYQTVVAREGGYHVFAKMAGDEDFRGIILVRKDSGIETPEDLRGKAVAYPAPTALAATLLTQWFLQRAGVNVRKDIDNRYVGSQESSIMNVYLGESAAAATWPPPWRAFQKTNPEVAAKLEVKWQTDSLVNNSVMVRDGVPPAVLEQVKAAFVDLDKTEAGRAILARMELSRFELADDRTYDPVAAFIADFEREVRPVKEAQP
jgi:phosphonate transport system substrate-binding protein